MKRTTKREAARAATVQAVIGDASCDEWEIGMYDQTEDHQVAIRSVTMDRIVAIIPTEDAINSNAQEDALARLICALPDVYRAAVALLHGWEKNLTTAAGELRKALENAGVKL